VEREHRTKLRIGSRLPFNPSGNARSSTPSHLAAKSWQIRPLLDGHVSGPVSSAQSWARDGMSVRREGRFVTAEVGEREEWLGRESHMPRPAQVVTGKGDLSEAKKESIAVMRKARRRGRSDPDSARNKP